MIRIACTLALLGLACHAPDARADSFGNSEGRERPVYSEYIRQSVYVRVRDGTELAVDIVRPAREGRAVPGRMAAVLEITPYGRAWVDKTGRLRDCIACAQHFWRYGYVAAAVDSRGTGASFGNAIEGPYTRAGGRDAHDIIEWIARQNWSNGKVGLVGASFAGRIQFHAASEAPPALEALMPAMAAFDNFDGHAVRGGLVGQAALTWTPAVDARGSDESSDSDAREASAAEGASGERALRIAPVDADPDGRRRDEAQRLNAEALAREDRFAAQVGAALADGMGRDEVPWGTALQPDGFVNHSDLLPAVNEARIPIYLWQGWIDTFVTDAVRWYANLRAPRKITIGNWAHQNFARGAQQDARDAEQQRLYEIESLRWFDHWLLGRSTGVLEDPAVHYAIEDSSGAWSWKSSGSLDFVTTARSTAWHLRGGGKQRGSGVAARLVSGEALDDPTPGVTLLDIDPSATTGFGRQWDALDLVTLHRDFGRPELYPDLQLNDHRGVAFTAEPLQADLELFGAPVVVLHISAETRDAVVAVTLTEVYPDGRSRYLGNATSLASYRRLAAPPYANFDWPWQSGLAADAARATPLSQGVATLTLTLDPIARRIRQGNRLRLTVHGADKDNVLAASVPETMPDQLRIHHSREHDSRLLLPVVRAAERTRVAVR